ncbi:MAG: carboxypeptidase-like regulatory domain-containing protein [Polyangiaceae bacterium]
MKVRIRGTASLEARLIPAESGVELRSRLTDDTGRPIGKAHVRLRLDPAPSRLPAATVCGNTPLTALHRSLGEFILDTSAEGTFCLRIVELNDDTKLQLTFDGDADYDSLTKQVEVDKSRTPLALRFQPMPATLALEREQHSVWVATRSDTDLGLEPQKVQLELFLKEFSGEETKLGQVGVSLGQRAQFLVPTTSLGAPGAAQLVARFPGTRTLSPAETEAPILRTTEVNLTLDEAPTPETARGKPLELAVMSTVGPVPSGSVEAIYDGRSMGTTPVRDGRASLVLELEGDTGPAHLTLRFLPSSPAWVSSGNLEIEVPVPPPSPWGRIALVACALLITAWLVRAWYRPGRHESKEAEERKSIPSGKPALELLEPAGAGSGWRGRVSDAHEGTPIRDATITLLIPAFSSDGVAARANTDAEGRFELEHVDFATAEGSRFRIEAPWHSTLERPVPRPGAIAISMVSRRRALIDRLVQWTGRKGRPWSTDGGATPRHVANVAQSKGQPEVAEWAANVEQAAYGPVAPDADAEQRINRQQPGRAEAE